MDDFTQAVTRMGEALTPKPWTYTTAYGTVLKVVAAGLPHAEPGKAKVLISVNPLYGAVVEVGVPTAVMPDLITAVTSRMSDWTHEMLVDDITAVSAPDGSLALVLGTVKYLPKRAEFVAPVVIPEEDRAELACALGRALNAALSRGD